MLSEKINWRKLFLKLSPVLIISLGLHGLALFIPVPDESPSADPETDLPAPIPVTDLPITDLPIVDKPPAPLPETTFAPTVVPEPPVPQPPAQVPVPEQAPEQPPEPAPIIQPPPQVIVVEPDPPEPTPQPTPAPEPTPTPQSTPAPTPEPTPEPVVQVRRSRGTSPADIDQKRNESTQNLSNLTAANPGAFKQVKAPLTLNFPADGYCIKTDTEEDVSAVETFVAIVIEKDASGDLYFIDGSVIDTADYDVIDAWVDRTVFPPDELDPNVAKPLKIPETTDLDIFQWVQNSYGEALFEENETVATFGISTTVALVNNCSSQ